MNEFHESWLTAYLDDELSVEDRALVERKLQSEPSLQVILDDIKAVREMVASLANPQLDNEVLSRDLTPIVMDRVRESETVPGGLPKLDLPIPSREIKSSFRTWPLLAVALAASLVGILLSFQLSMPGNMSLARVSVSAPKGAPTQEVLADSAPAANGVESANVLEQKVDPNASRGEQGLVRSDPSAAIDPSQASMKSLPESSARRKDMFGLGPATESNLPAAPMSAAPSDPQVMKAPAPPSNSMGGMPGSAMRSSDKRESAPMQMRGAGSRQVSPTGKAPEQIMAPGRTTTGRATESGKEAESGKPMRLAEKGTGEVVESSSLYFLHIPNETDRANQPQWGTNPKFVDSIVFQIDRSLSRSELQELGFEPLGMDQLQREDLGRKVPSGSEFQFDTKFEKPSRGTPSKEKQARLEPNSTPTDSQRWKLIMPQEKVKEFAEKLRVTGRTLQLRSQPSPIPFPGSQESLRVDGPARPPSVDNPMQIDEPRWVLIELSPPPAPGNR